MQRYFLKENYEEKMAYHLTGDDFHHAAHVMRMKTGDKCFLTFHDETVLIAEVIDITESQIALKELQKEEKEKEMPYSVTIACGFTKGDKLEWVAQKATELGMGELIGFPSKTSVVKWDEKKLVKKQQRFEKIVKEAAEQSHRSQIPTVQLLSKFQAFENQLSDYKHILVAYEESAKENETKSFVRVIQEIQPGENVLIIFGPEGGITPEEIELFESHKAVLCGLGPRILRAETAPLYALSAMSYQWELLK
ncbi:16S rRNA (uracil(1498)-N(3))-methyltransferase [Vagococcus carniphilus]|uniref:16S rRNA (uracil(1498)-N(3))-methyltransferase n=1 Tax=Vagococcus carniphilus TaxID=218144 RepID=UPI00288DFDCB|nr:16S rRNA (uracil(1498)-N(3))-methyltransferase [Vagococcus carniphilus]MDT2850322.1 16S rRNA (uracil(1498)-N(3))-methyltransferase [Vagococcus carniphilus]